MGMLLGNGASPGQMQQVLMVETGQLAGRMGDAAGPSTQAKGMKHIDKELKKHLEPLPIETNLDEFQQESKHEGFRWLFASPWSVVGIQEDDDISKAGGQEALEIFLASRGRGGDHPGNSRLQLGTRGKQVIQRFNRYGVSGAQWNFVRRAMQDRVGQLRAAFYRIARKYVPSKRVPAWVVEKFGAVEMNGKSVLNETGLRNGAEAFIEFTVTSPGVVGNPNLVKKFQGAIELSRFTIDAKLKKIAKGAKYVFTTGQVYFPKVNDDE